MCPSHFDRPGPGSQKGLTLIELMVAMVVGLVLMTGVIQILMGSKDGMRWQEELARIQENGRFALHLLRQEVREAGYSGCNPVVTNLLNPAGVGYTPTLFELNAPATGWEFGGTASGDTYSLASTNPVGVGVSSWDDAAGSDLDASLQDLVVPGTDVVVVKRAAALAGVTASGNTPANANTINLTSASGIAKGTILMISDCSGADVFQNRSDASASNVTRGASNNNPGPGNVNPGANQFSHRYQADAEIYTVAVTTFYVGVGAGNEPTLYRIDYNSGSAGTPVAIVQGIENLQVLYGLDLSGDEVPERYVTADGIGANTDQVVAVKVAMLMRSLAAVDPTNPTSQTFNLLGTDVVTPADGRARRLLSSTIKLRNRGEL
ncbi:MAG: PilW family protein [Pseudomonadota bacterium]|nr:PilW family protein [Pseudomonadota bacterium]